MKKRVCALLLAVCIAAGLILQFPVTAAATEPDDLPEAGVEYICNKTIRDEDNFTLQFGMTFTAPDTPSDYDDWYVDYELTFNKDVYGKDGILAGSYEAYKEGEWVIIEVPEDDPNYNAKLFPAYRTVRIIKSFSGAVFGSPEAELNYGFIRDVVGTFQCGLTLKPEFWEANSDAAAKLALKMYNPGTGESYTVGDDYVFTMGATAPHICVESNWVKSENTHYKKHCVYADCPFYRLDPTKNKYEESAHTFGADDFCMTCGYLRDADPKAAAPKTGDTTHTLLWTALFLGGVAMMWMQLNDRKREMF